MQDFVVLALKINTPYKHWASLKATKQSRSPRKNTLSQLSRDRKRDRTYVFPFPEHAAVQEEFVHLWQLQVTLLYVPSEQNSVAPPLIISQCIVGVVCNIVGVVSIYQGQSTRVRTQLVEKPCPETDRN